MDNQILDFIYKWHRFEKTKGNDIIDFDLIQLGKDFPGQFKNRLEVKTKLIALIEDYSSYSQKDIYITTKLNSFLTYLNALMGEKLPFSEYIKETMAIEPKIIPDKELEELKELNIKLLKKLGYEYTKEGFEEYTQKTTLSKKQILANFKRAEKEFLPKIKNWLNLNLEIQYLTKVVDKDVYWYCFISTNDQGVIELKFNLNKRHVWKKGAPEFLVLHEICSHGIQSASWKKQIIEGKISKVFGLTEVFTPDVFLQEGIADSLWLFYPGKIFDDFGYLLANFWKLGHFVDNNALIMANTGKDLNEIEKYQDYYLPGFKSREARIKTLIEGRDHPLYRTYLYVYGIAHYYFNKIAEKLNDEQKREFVLDIYQNFYTPEQLIEKI